MASTDGDEAVDGPTPGSGGSKYVRDTGDGYLGARKVSRDGDSGRPKAHVAIGVYDEVDWEYGDRVVATAVAPGVVRLTRAVEAAHDGGECVLSAKPVLDRNGTTTVHVHRADAEHLGLQPGDYVRAYERGDDVLVCRACADPLVGADPPEVTPLAATGAASAEGDAPADANADDPADTADGTTGRDRDTTLVSWSGDP